MGKNDVHWAAAEVLLALSCPSPAPRLMPWSSPDQRAPPPLLGFTDFPCPLLAASGRILPCTSLPGSPTRNALAYPAVDDQGLL